MVCLHDRTFVQEHHSLVSLVEQFLGVALPHPPRGAPPAPAHLGLDKLLCITRRVMFTTRREVIDTPVTAATANQNTLSLIKDIYARLFRWLVARVNKVGAETSNRGRRFQTGLPTQMVLSQNATTPTHLPVGAHARARIRHTCVHWYFGHFWVRGLLEKWSRPIMYQLCKREATNAVQRACIRA